MTNGISGYLNLGASRLSHCQCHHQITRSTIIATEQNNYFCYIILVLIVHKKLSGLGEGKDKENTTKASHNIKW